MHIPFIIQQIYAFLRIADSVVLCYIIITLCFSLTCTDHKGYIDIGYGGAQLLYGIYRLLLFPYIQITPSNLLKAAVYIHMTVCAVIAFRIRLQIFGQRLRFFLIINLIVKFSYKSQFLRNMIFVCLNDPCIISDHLSI